MPAACKQTRYSSFTLRALKAIYLSVIRKIYVFHLNNFLRSKRAMLLDPISNFFLIHVVLHGGLTGFMFCFDLFFLGYFEPPK